MSNLEVLSYWGNGRRTSYGILFPRASDMNALFHQRGAADVIRSYQPGRSSAEQRCWTSSKDCAQCRPGSKMMGAFRHDSDGCAIKLADSPLSSSCALSAPRLNNCASDHRFLVEMDSFALFRVLPPLKLSSVPRSEGNSTSLFALYRRFFVPNRNNLETTFLQGPQPTSQAALRPVW